ncbi:MAG: YigZ family protein [Alphaproteobacteria bacterium]|nr:YigZ family protein [Alphaproteobacteria bacterium]
MPLVTTLAGPAHVEPPRIKGSRFVGDAAPVDDEAAAMAFVDAIRAASSDASHHCFAWRLGDDHTRASDAGEPAGTAGEPILRRIVGADLHGVVVVVTRWFGGTKLGTGGLVRAYGATAAEALDAAPRLVRPVTAPVWVDVPWDLGGVVTGVLAAHGLSPVHTAFDAGQHLVLAVPVEQVDALLSDLSERTAGRVVGRTTP